MAAISLLGYTETTMTITFADSPLVELIAELRWWPASVPQVHIQGPAIGQQPLFGISSTQEEEVFMRFGGEVYKNGFTRAERLSPPGSMQVVGQAVSRYRKDDAGVSELLQIGPGVFTANALPPYKSWQTFSPTVRIGVDALFKSRSEADNARAFSNMSLRYVNAFSSKYWGGGSAESFLSEKLGLSINAPEGVVGVRSPDGIIQHAGQVIIPVADGASVAVSFGQAVVNGEPSVMLELAYLRSGEIHANVDAVMDRFNGARDVLHGIFVSMTASIQSRLSPMEE